MNQTIVDGWVRFEAVGKCPFSVDGDVIELAVFW